MTKIDAGTWVEIEQVILTPEQRAPSLPEDTRRVPFVMRVSGFLLEHAEIGQPARVRTIIGRELSGSLKEVNPSFRHGFGETVPELLTIGLEVER